MTEWWEPLTDDPMEWLLESDDPSITYFFLSEILERPDHSRPLRDARQQIRTSPAVQTILDHQHADGWWETPDHLTEPKHRTTLWRLYLLAELGMTGQDFRVATAADYVLETFMTSDGDFLLTPDGPVVRHWVPGLLLWSLYRLGYLEDERIRRATGRMVDIAVAGDWIGRDADGRPRPWAGLRTLWAISAVPAQYRSSGMEEVVGQGANAFLQHALMTPSAEAKQLSFPNYDPQDVLYALRVLTALGFGSDPRVTSVLEKLLQKQVDGGRWPVERVFENDGLDWGEPGRANRWITLNVLRVLKRVYV